jgi:hypothetical protein
MLIVIRPVPLANLRMVRLRGCVSVNHATMTGRWRRDVRTGTASTREARTSAKKGMEMKRIFEGDGYDLMRLRWGQSSCFSFSQVSLIDKTLARRGAELGYMTDARPNLATTTS